MFKAFPSIGQFRQAVRAVKLRDSYRGKDNDGSPIYEAPEKYSKMMFEGSVKLHGTNTGICCTPDGQLLPLSRKLQISIENDPYKFAAFVKEYEKDFLSIFDKITNRESNVYLYGEWAGPRVQKNVAISQLPEKHFFAFAIRQDVDDKTIWSNPLLSSLNISSRIQSVNEIVTPKYLMIDFNDSNQAIPELAELVEEVERCCPVAKAFGIEGVGEGLVWKPVDLMSETNLWFKTKGEKHSPTKVTKLPTVDIEKMNRIKKFVEATVTDTRLEQGFQLLKEEGKPLDRSSTGNFIRWVFNDILAEDSDLMEECGLTKKDLGSQVSRAARTWFFKQV